MFNFALKIENENAEIMEIIKNQIDAIDDILRIVKPWIKKGPSGIDSTEPLSILAILAGSFLFRSFDFKLDNVKPGSKINIHSEIETKKEYQLIIITQASLRFQGIETEVKFLPYRYIKHENNYFIDVISKVQEPAWQIMKKYSLTYEQMAHSIAIATTYFIQKQENMTIEKGLDYAIYHYYLGSRTYPPNFVANIVSEKFENKFEKVMSDRSDEELIKIVTLERSSYQPLAVEAANREIKKRNIDILSNLQKIWESQPIDNKNDLEIGKQLSRFWTNFAYVALLLTAGIYGIIVGCNYLYSKQKTGDRNKIFAYNKSSREEGRVMIFLGCVVLGINIILTILD